MNSKRSYIISIIVIANILQKCEFYVIRRTPGLKVTTRLLSYNVVDSDNPRPHIKVNNRQPVNNNPFKKIYPEKKDQREGVLPTSLSNAEQNTLFAEQSDKISSKEQEENNQPGHNDRYKNKYFEKQPKHEGVWPTSLSNAEQSSLFAQQSDNYYSKEQEENHQLVHNNKYKNGYIEKQTKHGGVWPTSLSDAEQDTRFAEQSDKFSSREQEEKKPKVKIYTISKSNKNIKRQKGVPGQSPVVQYVATATKNVDNKLFRPRWIVNAENKHEFQQLFDQHKKRMERHLNLEDVDENENRVVSMKMKIAQEKEQFKHQQKMFDMANKEAYEAPTPVADKKDTETIQFNIGWNEPHQWTADIGPWDDRKGDNVVGYREDNPELDEPVQKEPSLDRTFGKQTKIRHGLKHGLRQGEAKEDNDENQEKLTLTEEEKAAALASIQDKDLQLTDAEKDTVLQTINESIAVDKATEMEVRRDTSTVKPVTGTNKPFGVKITNDGAHKAKKIRFNLAI